jgi:hypothetical protein
MGSLDTINPASGPALPDTPPITTRELAVGLVGLFGKADGLVQPRYVSISRAAQDFGLQFDNSADGRTAIEAWAQRFGAPLTSSDHTNKDGTLSTYVECTFDFFGVEVVAYAFIPAEQTGT